MNILKLMLILSVFGCFMGIKCSAPAGYGSTSAAASVPEPGNSSKQPQEYSSTNEYEGIETAERAKILEELRTRVILYRDNLDTLEENLQMLQQHIHESAPGSSSRLAYEKDFKKTEEKRNAAVRLLITEIANQSKMYTDDGQLRDFKALTSAAQSAQASVASSQAHPSFSSQQQVSSLPVIWRRIEEMEERVKELEKKPYVRLYALNKERPALLEEIEAAKGNNKSYKAQEEQLKKMNEEIERLKIETSAAEQAAIPSAEQERNLKKWRQEQFKLVEEYSNLALAQDQYPIMLEKGMHYARTQAKKYKNNNAICADQVRIDINEDQTEYDYDENDEDELIEPLFKRHGIAKTESDNIENDLNEPLLKKSGITQKKKGKK